MFLIPGAIDIFLLFQLPNRLGKMLAPLHWHDYKKQYGKLDDFVARHPEVSVHALYLFIPVDLDPTMIVLYSDYVNSVICN